MNLVVLKNIKKVLNQCGKTI